MPYRTCFFPLAALFLCLVSSGLVSSDCAGAEDEPSVTIVRNVEYGRAGEEKLLADLYLPGGKGIRPAVLVVHGGGWMFGQRTQLSGVSVKLAERGYVALAISYRLAPKHPFPAQLEDCQTAIRWMRTEGAKRYRIDSDRIGGYGYSAGGHLVTMLAVCAQQRQAEKESAQQTKPSARIQVAVAGGAPCDFRILPAKSRALAYWLGGSREEKPEAYVQASPASFVSRDDSPIFFIHGEKDKLVPMLSPWIMTATMQALGIDSQLYRVAEAGHLGAMHDRTAMEKGIEFLDRYLSKESE